jgi:undecaprenyl-diphosphatase
MSSFLEFLFELDKVITLYVSAIRNPIFDVIFRSLTLFGSLPMVVGVFVCLAFVAKVMHRKPIWAFFMASLAVGAGLSWFLKYATERERPLGGIIPVEGYSFPSTHALMAVICYGFLGYYMYTYAETKSTKILGIVILVAMPFIVGISRIYLGVHWFSDVLGGWSLGVLLLAAAISHVQYLQNQHDSDSAKIC